MPKRQKPLARWVTALTWPAGIVLTSLDYMWRSTPLHRREYDSPDVPEHRPPAFPPGIDRREVIGVEDGVGPLFHRQYSTTIRETSLTAEGLFASLAEDLNVAAPKSFARFKKVHGEPHNLRAGDEYVVRMPGPWDGPVRVVDRQPDSLRLATLDGHLEAGQIEFRAREDEDGRLRFEIESWARSSSAMTNVLYHWLHMAKEVQFHMWTSYLEGVVKLSGGRMTGGVHSITYRVEGFGDE